MSSGGGRMEKHLGVKEDEPDEGGDKQRLQQGKGRDSGARDVQEL